MILTRMVALLALVVMPMLMLTGCKTRVGDLSVISTRNVSLDRVDLDHLPQTSNVEGEDSKWIFLIIPTGVPHLEDAIDDALIKGNGDVMVDAVVHSSGWWFLLGQSTLSVRGTVVNTRGAGQ